MPRASKTHVRGLYREASGRFRIDLRWREPSTGEYRRFRERLPQGIAAAAAKHRALEIANSALAGGFDPRREVPRRLTVAIEAYQKWADVNRPRTAKSRESLARVIQDILGDPRLDELSPFHVERLKRDRAAAGASPATVNRTVAMLKHLCGLAAEWGWISDAKAKAIRAVKLLREPPGRVRYLSGDEESRLMGALPKGLRPIVAAALLSGMRAGELVGLRKDAVDLPGRMVTLIRTKTNRVRRVPINDALAAVLEQAAANSRVDYVFTSRLGTPYTRRAVSHMFHRAVVKAKIENLRLHDMRHDFATKLRRHGVGIDAIAALLGHSSLAMTQRYAHIGIETLRAAVNGLPALAMPSESSSPRRQSSRKNKAASR